jgi:tetratricopeptide (TPR) repeat protein/CHAT domain-containing protein
MAHNPRRDEKARFLQLRGTALRIKGRDAEAHAIFLEAFQLFGADEETFLAASLAHDLAISYRGLETGIVRENLQRARELAESALANRERRRDPIRMANTWDVLSTIKRRMAAAAAEPERGDLYAEALADVRRAIKVGTTALRLHSTPAWQRELAGFHVSLGNIHSEMGNIDAALSEYRIAVAKLEANGDRRHDADFDNALFQTLLNLSNLLLARGRQKDLDDAAGLAGRVARAADSHWRSRGNLRLAKAHLQRGDDASIDKARATLSLVEHEFLEGSEIELFVDLAERLGVPDLAIEAIIARISQGFDEFSATSADADGDAVAYRIQTLSYLGARVLHRVGRPLEAFIMLERAGAPRFEEAVKAHALLPKTPLAAELVRLAEVASARAAALAQIAATPAETQQEILVRAEADWSARLAHECPPHEREPLGLMIESVRSARAVADPMASLQADAKRASREVTLIWKALDRLEPRRVAIREKVDGVPTVEQIAEIVAAHPGTVFLRLELHDELIAASIYLTDGRLGGRSEIIVLSPEARRLIFDLWGDRRASNADALFKEFDLSTVLPSDRRERLVILAPRSLSVLPLAAAGPAGRTPLDLFASVVWLPSLAPLRIDAPAHPPRRGAAVFVPTGTRLGATAFAPLHLQSAIFAGAEAARSSMLSALREAETLVFYTHGGHDDLSGHPGIELSDGRLSLDSLSWNWMGIERVELWACDSALEHATDPRTTGLEGETFGLDGQLLRHGVRTTIAAQRPLHEFIAVVLHAHYRRALAAGTSPDAALATAMRHWRDADVPELLRAVGGEQPIDTALHAFLEARGVGLGTASGGTVGVLGPVEAEDVGESETRTRALVAGLGSPFEWATLRFQGIPGRRPTDETPPITETWIPQPEEVAEEARRLLTLAREAANRPRDFLQIEARIEQLMAELDQRDWDAATVIRLAETFRVREVGSTTHNLIMGLAWLHEALGRDPSGPRAVELRLKAATLWLHLAVTLSATWHLAGVLSCARGPVESARRALEGLPAARTVGHRAILRIVDAAAADSRDLGSALRSESLAADGDDDSLWLLAEAMVYIAEDAKDAVKDLLHRGFSRLPRTEDVDVVEWYGGTRLGFSLYRAGREAGFEVPFPPGNATFLVGRERMLFMLDAVGGVEERSRGPAAKRASLDLMSAGLSEVESSVWGSLKPAWSHRFMATGVPVPMYHLGVAGIVGANLEPGASKGHLSGLVATLHLGADLRLLHLNRIAGIASWMGRAARNKRLDDFRRDLRVRDAALETLADWIVDPVLGPTERPEPFVLTPTELMESLRGPEHATAFAVAKVAGLFSEPGASGAGTAAYRAVRMAWSLSVELTKVWASLLAAADEHPEIRGTGFPDALGDISLRIDDNDPWLLGQPPTEAVLHLGVHADGRWWGVLVNGQHRRVAAATRADSRASTEALAQLLGPERTDFKGRGQSGKRATGLLKLRDHLRPLLTELLDEPLRGGLKRLMVFSPGVLRGLPVVGLAVGERTISEALDSVIHLPALKWVSENRPAPAGRACLFNHDVDGDTSFGRAVTLTQRQVLPPTLVVACPDDTSLEILEANQIEAAAGGLGTIRLYSEGADIGFTSASCGIALSGGRVLSDHNTWWMSLASTQLVEIWAATGIRHADFILERSDRIPGMARSFLAAGAAAVLDIAWPIHDLVKALVSEHFGLLHLRRGASPSRALNQAVAAVDGRLRAWKAAGPYRSVAASLSWLDRERAAVLRDHGLPTEAVVPLPVPPAEDLPSAEAFVSEVCQPSHLAAFRLWGAL